ncbi:unnamed protein product [Peronospora belbahrii]|uniref:Uncharacterized protein n=1 Tax=Peronospora belbahrii TaxID=622444 RepID=A0ABN8DD72_9STRA|nr:unnamed protein product [Peronospora belbahrii]
MRYKRLGQDHRQRKSASASPFPGLTGVEESFHEAVGWDTCWSAKDVAKKAPSASKQVKSEWLSLGTVVELGIGDRVWITYANHSAELLTMKLSKLCSTESFMRSSMAEIFHRSWSAVDAKFLQRETSSASPRREPSLRVMCQSLSLARVIRLDCAVGLRSTMVRSALDVLIWSDYLATSAGASVSIKVAIQRFGRRSRRRRCTRSCQRSDREVRRVGWLGLVDLLPGK